MMSVYTYKYIFSEFFAKLYKEKCRTFLFSSINKIKLEYLECSIRCARVHKTTNYIQRAVYIRIWYAVRCTRVYVYGALKLRTKVVMCVDDGAVLFPFFFL